MENELLVPHVDGMASVGPSLISGNDVRLFSEDIHDLTFSLVAPLPSHHHCAAAAAHAIGHGNHGSFPGSGSRAKARPVRNKKGPPRGRALDSFILRGK